MFESWYVLLAIIFGGLILSALTDVGRGIFTAIAAIFHVLFKSIGLVRGHGDKPPASQIPDVWGIERLDSPHHLKVSCHAPLSKGDKIEFFEVDVSPDEGSTKIRCPVCAKKLAITNVQKKAVLVHDGNFGSAELRDKIIPRLENAKWGVWGGLAALSVLPIGFYVATVMTANDTLGNRLAAYALVFMFLAAPFGLGGLQLLVNYIEKIGKTKNGKLKSGELILVDETLSAGIREMPEARTVLFEQEIGQLTGGAYHGIAAGGVTALSEEKKLAAQGIPKGALALIKRDAHRASAQNFPMDWLSKEEKTA